MKNPIITGIMAATILIAGCEKKSPSSSVTPQLAQATATLSTSGAQPRARAIVTNAKSIVLPEFKLDGVTLPEALKQLRDASKQNSPDGKGFNFMIANPDVIGAIPKITLALKNITVADAVEHLAKIAGVSVSAEDYGFVFDPKSHKP